MTLFATLARAKMDNVAIRRRKRDTLEESMKLFSTWTNEEVQAVEPELHDARLMNALLSTKDDMHTPAARVATSCPDFLAESLAALLLSLQNTPRLPLPAQVPQWMREMDPPNSLVTTVSLPSGWDAPSARISSSSIFNVFSDRPASPTPSIFAINPESAASTVSVPGSFWDVASPTPSIFGINPASAASTVSVPASFWNAASPMPSTLSINSSNASTVSVPASFWNTSSTVSVTGQLASIASATSTLFVDPSEVSSSSASSLFPDPREALSDASSLFLDPSSVHSGASSPSHHSVVCIDCQVAHSLAEYTESSLETTSYPSHRTSGCFDCQRDDWCSVKMDTESSVSLLSNPWQYAVTLCTDCQRVSAINVVDDICEEEDVSSSSSGYETDVDSDPRERKMSATVSATTQTEKESRELAIRMLAECDAMLEKLVIMRKQLKEML